ncbi:flagellar biosynthesis repressor FlbT [Sphingomonas koreensis]|jgi:flagellar protein FlbT|uniref:Flagellar biosynthesis repressor FlbT n=1 Tax=Sphingomonas koreensis TaxID=93064 RepID=A0A1L6J9I3_9SPHN|nr:flagellar biosynthesis repressor FlbT [Sphingomonas koreensis]APR52568.1 flagellar biosynthesis repressor FlbT [Sphingomonas koreensis]MDC7812902.1 flagellar biosynthesis repressor FlbT [Sphingomonas koreensis]PJI87887.1 flagellar protein FlbT [Sphingomonas koreensis]RSU18231.1 flagellar biosynthesis repressor FlbT [Sphingomonas koreensis]RSU28609.1 flagellar biosynthesis repressor FlbT [Sphingomonas koreensis]
MTLRISLRNGEPVIVNGAVLRSVGRTDLMVENNATVLRGRDVMKPEEADSPARQLYFACMMAYIDQGDLKTHQDALLERLERLMAALESQEAKAACIRFAQKVATGQFYPALADCRWLIGYETEVLNRAALAA